MKYGVTSHPRIKISFIGIFVTRASLYRCNKRRASLTPIQLRVSKSGCPCRANTIFTKPAPYPKNQLIYNERRSSRYVSYNCKWPNVPFSACQFSLKNCSRASCPSTYSHSFHNFFAKEACLFPHVAKSGLRMKD